MLTRRAWSMAVLNALAAAACRRPANGRPVYLGASTTASALHAEGAQQRPIELLTWWTRRGKNEAFNYLVDTHKRRHPADLIIHANSDSSGAMRKTLAARISAGEPPDAFQANVGTDLLRWVLISGLDARESKVMVLDDLPIARELRAVVPSMVLESMSVEGHLYGIPGNLHKINCLFYNKSIFKKYELTEPSTPDDLLAMGQKLRGTGIPLLAVGSRAPWTLPLLAFESLLVGREGAAFYRDYFKGMHDPRDRRIIAMLKQLLELLEYVNPDHRKLDWLQAVNLVIEGQAACTVMGDWSQIPFVSANLKQGVEYQEMTFPGHPEAFVFTSDAFAIPKRAKNKEGASRVLATLASLECQSAMHQGNGTLSVRTDVGVNENDPVLRHKHHQLSHGDLALALSGAVPTLLADDLGVALADMIEQRDLEPVLQTLRSRYVLLRPP